MKRYKITYPEGISQEKNLLNEEEYEKVKDLNSRLSDLKQQLGDINKRKKFDQWNLCNSKIKEIESELSIYGEWFIINSPIGQALLNGGYLILPTYKSDGSKKDHYPTTFEEVE